MDKFFHDISEHSINQLISGGIFKAILIYKLPICIYIITITKQCITLYTNETLHLKLLHTGSEWRLTLLACSSSDICIALPSPSPRRPGNWLCSSMF